MKHKFNIIVFIGLLAIVMFNACKKQDTNGNNTSTDDKTLQEFRKKMANEGYQTVTLLNQKGFTFSYTDKDGNEVMMNNRYSSRTNSIQDVCGTSCENASDPGDLQPDAILLSCTRAFNCGSASQTSTLTMTWQLSLPYTILLESPLNSAFKSKGKIRFKTSTGSIFYSDTNITPITITNLGTDPNCSEHTLFRVSYSVSGIDNDFFDYGNTLENGMYLYNDCFLASYNNTVNYQSIYTWNIPGPASSPCSRTDKVWINPGTGSGGTVVALGVGNTMGCTNPSGWISPDVQHMEYWNNTDPSTVYTANIGPLGVYTMTETTPSSGDWTIRYRNEMTSSPACEGPWFYEYFSN